MKKLMLVCAAVAALCGCSQRSTLPDGRLVVGFDAAFPPKEKRWQPSQEEFFIYSHSTVKI